MRSSLRWSIITLFISVQISLINIGIAYSEMVIYPSKGQTEAQQTTDRGECHTWAVKETGVDPAQLVNSTVPQPTQKRDHKIVKGAAAGALGGVAIGAIAGDSEKGAAIGAAAGGIGGAVRQRRQKNAQQANSEQIVAEQQSAVGRYEKAYGACLTGRGYSVK